MNKVKVASIFGICIFFLLSCESSDEYSFPDHYKRVDIIKIKKQKLEEEIPNICTIIRKTVLKYFKSNIAVFPLIINGNMDGVIPGKISEILKDISDLEFKVFGTDDIRKIIIANRFNINDIFDETKLSNFGKRFGYQVIMFGTITKTGKNEKLLIKLLDPDTETVLNIVTYEISSE